MIQITDLESGKQYTDSQTDLRAIWESVYMNPAQPEEEMEAWMDEEHEAEMFAVQISDGCIELVGCNDEMLCEPIVLKYPRFSIQFTETWSRSQIEKALETLKSGCIEVQGYTYTYDGKMKGGTGMMVSFHYVQKVLTQLLNNEIR